MKNTREHILNVSLSLFLQKGFKEVTMREIVKKTGMSKGAIYHYFKSKEQLFFEIIDITISSVVEVEYSKFSKDSLYQFYHDYVDHFQSYTNHFFGSLNQQNKSEDENTLRMNYFSFLLDALKRFPNFHEKLFESRQLELDSWKEIVRIARSKGEINSSMDDGQIAKMFIFSADGAGMYTIFLKCSSEDTWNALLGLWDNFYNELKA